MLDVQCTIVRWSHLPGSLNSMGTLCAVPHSLSQNQLTEDFLHVALGGCGDHLEETRGTLPRL